MFIRQSNQSILFKVKNSEIKPYQFWLGNTSKDFTANNIRKSGLNGYVYHFSVDYNIIDPSNIASIHKCLMKKKAYQKIMFTIIKKNDNCIIN